MNIAAIFAGGVGKRMGTNGIPKQFLKLNEKPILVYTLEKFQNNTNIDAIVIAGLPQYIDYTWELAKQFGISKVMKVVSGGEYGQTSIYNALCAAEEIAKEGDIVLIHDGVRPLIDDNIINKNIESVKTNGNAITCVECKETVAQMGVEGKIIGTTDRNKSKLARAPQSFYLKDIISIHRRAIKDGNVDTIDSCTLVKMYTDEPLNPVLGDSINIKITTPEDFLLFKLITESNDVREAMNAIG